MMITWIGNHEEGLEAFERTAQRGFINGFITLNDEAFAKRSAGSRDYLDIADKYGIKVYPISTIKNDESYEIVKELAPDLMVVFGWSEILPERLLDLAKVGTVGTHAALLPHNRGSAPVNWAIIRGEEETGNTLMWLTKEVDSGTIIDQTAFPITLFDTCKTIYDKVAKSNAVMLDKLIDALIKGEKPLLDIKNETDESLLPRRRPKDGLVDWQQDAKKIYDFIRALTIPYPGAFTFLDGKKWLIWEAMVLPLKCSEAPGTILGQAYGFKDCGILTATKDYILCITMIEDEDGKRYSGSSLYELELKGVFGNE
ncbi:MAG: methionyl-tRNA formyltransferase [Lachnospiraceae bacterium]|nr:methionyl-tRNA formyltransferase [Lachnospiraceae bacterium]